MTAAAMKLVGYSKTPNTNKVLVTAKYAGVNIDMEQVIFGQTNRTPEFLARFPFGKIPALDTEEGSLYESNAIAYYIASKKEGLLGKTPYEQALVIQFICSLDCELNPFMMKTVYPLLGFTPYNAEEWKKSYEELLAKLKIYDNILLPRTYLVGESITLADILFACTLERVFTIILEEPQRKALLNLTRWFVTVANQPNFKAIMGELELCKKTAQPPKPAAVTKKQEKEEEQEEGAEEEPVQKPKEKNPLDLLPPSKLNLEEWKRFYSNCKETRPVATNWFWEHFDPEGWSIWRADYKYNSELQKIFMTCNLVTGLFHRMEALRKYCFATVLIFGDDDNSEMSGFFVLRGTEMPEMMKEVPDYESYEWTKVDPKDKKQVELFNDYLAWDGDLEGKVFNQGKIFK